MSVFLNMFPNVFLRLWLTGSLVVMSTAAVAAVPIAPRTPVCFMQTETGQMIDLSHLCGPNDGPTTSQSHPSPSGQQPKPASPQQGRGRGAAQRGVY